MRLDLLAVCSNRFLFLAVSLHEPICVMGLTVYFSLWK